MATSSEKKYSSVASSVSSRQSGRSFSRTLTTSSTDTFSAIIPQNLSFDELSNAVEYLHQIVTQLDIENQIFEAYLEDHSPGLIEDMDDTLEAMNAALLKLEYYDIRRDTLDTEASDEDESPEEHLEEMEENLAYTEENGMIIVTHKVPSELARLINIPSTISIRMTQSASAADSFYQRQLLSSMVKKRMAFNFERCPRMNFSQRIDVADWATDKQQERLKAAVDRGSSVGGLLRAQIETTGLRISETRKLVLHFNSKFRSSLFNEEKPLYADYFVKDIRGTVSSLDAINERIRLKMNQLKFYRRKLQADLAIKQELSESIRPVDIETLKIENEQLIQQIALKTKHLNDLKTVSGHATQRVNSNKKRLSELSQNLKNLRNEVVNKRNYISKMEQEEEPVVREAQKAERALTKIRERIGKFTAPDVLEYVRYKSDVRDLNKQTTSLKRRYSLRSRTAFELRGRVKYLEQKKSGDYAKSPLKETPPKFDGSRHSRRGLSGRDPILAACLPRRANCVEPSTCRSS